MPAERPPSVLIVTRTFPPDPAAVGALVAELARELAGRGWRVGVATATPRGGLTPDFPAGVEVAREAAAVEFTRSSLTRRLLSYLSIYPALLRAAWQLGTGWDVVVTTTDPPMQAALGPLIRWRTGGRLVHWCQDIYPELAEELGVIRRGGLLAGTLRGISSWALRRCDAVIALGRCMAERLRARGVSPDKIAIVPNWADAANVWPTPRAGNALREELGLGADRFVVMYSGNFGLAHPFEALLEAAETLRVEMPAVQFLLIGEGPRAASVKAEAKRRNLWNMRFLPLLPREQLAQSLGAADIHLVTMSERLSGLVVPSKFYGVLAAARPCIFIGPVESEVGSCVRESGCGETVAENDSAFLVTTIRRFAEDPAAWSRAAERAGELAREFTLPKSASKLVRAWQVPRNEDASKN